MLAGILLRIHNGLSLSDAPMTLILSFMVFSQIKLFGMGVSMLRMTAAAINRTVEIEQMPRMDENGKALAPKTHDISFEHVSFSYEKKPVLRDVTVNLPDKTTTAVIGEGGASLSGGEKQRISIAHAMLKDAPIVILDEATANVDPENEDRLQKAIEALTRNKTILMIAHRLKTVRNADQILVIDHGQIVQQGRHEELIAQPGIYRSFVGSKKRSRRVEAVWTVSSII